MKLKLLDTGYLSATTALTSQTQIADSNRAGRTGSAITSFTLDVSNISLSGDANTESKPIINTLSDSATTLVSVNNRRLSLSLIWYKSITTTGYTVNDLYQFFLVERTRGLKLLYPSAVADPNGMKTIVEAFGAVNTNGIFAAASPTDDNGTVSTTTPYLIGRVKNMSISDSSDGDYWRISFDFEISG